MDGVGRVVENYCRRLSERGEEVYAVCPMNDTGYRGKLSYEIVDFSSTVSMPKTPQYKAGVANLDAHYVKRIDMIRPDIVHVHSPATAGWEGVRLAKKWDVPLVGTFHSKFYDDIYNMTKSRAIAHVGASMIGEFFSNCDEVWTVSRYAACELQSYGYRGEIHIVRNGTNANFADPAPMEDVDELIGGRGEPVFLYVGQIDRKKNIGLILDACGVLKRRGCRFRFVLAGQGRDHERFRKQAQALDLEDRVVFTGHIRDPHLLAGLYKRALLFTFPSLYDTAGLVVSEAGSMGTPSVALCGSAPAEIIIDGHNGFLCQETPESLADAMQSALDDPQRTHAMGENAYREFPVPWDGVMDEVQARYAQLIESGRKPKKRLFRRAERDEFNTISEDARVKEADEEETETE